MTQKKNGEVASVANGEPVAPQFQIIAQYTKDLSFENPNAPTTYFEKAEQPKVEVNIDVKARKVNDEGSYEVALVIKATAKDNDKIHFVVELMYGGLFVIKNIDEPSLKPVLLIECPRHLFPFARAIIADVTRDGGYPPLMLQPVDFMALYRQQNQQQPVQAAS
jgi:preprotein translocase subunit SecB